MSLDLKKISAELHQIVDEIDESLIPDDGNNKSKNKKNKEEKGGLRKRTTIQENIEDKENKKEEVDTSKRLRRKNSKPLPDFYPHSHFAQSDDELDMSNFVFLSIYFI